ncbi:hypothetical protein DFH27DRAFT_615973 [Peziza echinospora]|nr:hypothetical protein DFH27DRAFT_615973 [Peziza echinospora]
MDGLTTATVPGTPPRSATAQMKPVDVSPASSTSSGHSGSSCQPSPDSDTEPNGGADNSLDEGPRVSAAAVDAVAAAVQATLAALPADKPYKYFAVNLDSEGTRSAAKMVRVAERRETERKRLKRKRELIYLRELRVSVLHYDFAKHMTATPALLALFSAFVNSRRQPIPAPAATAAAAAASTASTATAPASAEPVDAGALLTLLAGGTYTSTCEATWQLMNNTVHSISIVEASATARRIKTRGLRAGFGIILEPHLRAAAAPTAQTSLLSLLTNLFCVDDFAHLTADELARFPGAGHATYGVGKYLDALAAKEKDAAYVKEITAWNNEIQSEVNDRWATSMLGTGKIASMKKVKMLEAQILDQQKALEDQQQQSSTMEQQLRQSLGEQGQKLDQNTQHTATLEQKLDQQSLDSKQEIKKLTDIVMQLMAANRTPPSPPPTSPSGGSTTSPASSDRHEPHLQRQRKRY